MIIKSLKIKDVKLIKPNILRDKRGFFFEAFNKKKFDKAIGRKVKFVQDNHSKSKMGVLRGLHYQKPPFEQDKLVRVIKGKIFDVAVDIRKDSKFYGKWVGEILSDRNKKQLYIPKGFAHGFLVLSKNAEVLYKTTNFYSKEHEIVFLWSDKILKINWPIKKGLTISKKDKKGLPLF